MACRRRPWASVAGDAPPDRADYDCICYARGGSGGSGDKWSFSNGSDHQIVSIVPRLVSNSAVAVHRAAVDGAGLAVLSHILALPHIAAGRLRVVMPDYPPSRMPNYAVYPSRRNVPARVRSVLDFLIDSVAADEAMRTDDSDGA